MLREQPALRTARWDFLLRGARCAPLILRRSPGIKTNVPSYPAGTQLLTSRRNDIVRLVPIADVRSPI